MEWQPIETAPLDVYVQLGRWCDYGDGPGWQTNNGYGRKTVRLFGFYLWTKPCEWEGASYWRHWPAPPMEPSK